MGYDVYIGRLKNVDAEVKTLEDVKSAIATLKIMGLDVSDKLQIQVEALEEGLYRLTDGCKPLEFDGKNFAIIQDFTLLETSDSDVFVIDIEKLPTGTRYISVTHNY